MKSGMEKVSANWRCPGCRVSTGCPLGTAEIVEYVDILPRDGEALKRQLRPVQTVRRKISGSFLHGHKSVDTTEDKHRIGIEKRAPSLNSVTFIYRRYG